MNNVDTLSFRSAKSSDAALILTFIKELAEYEKMSDKVEASKEDIKSSVDNPLCLHSGRMRIFFQILKWKFKFMLCYLHAEGVPLQALSYRRTGTADDKDHRLLPLCLEPPSGILFQVL